MELTDLTINSQPMRITGGLSPIGSVNVTLEEDQKRDIVDQVCDEIVHRFETVAPIPKPERTYVNRSYCVRSYDGYVAQSDIDNWCKDHPECYVQAITQTALQASNEILTTIIYKEAI